MKVYESIIEVSLDPAFESARQRNDDLKRQLQTLRQKHEAIRARRAVETGLTQERALLDFLWQRACLLDHAAGGRGYVGSFENCAFNLLYGVFGIDILAFLFGRAWVPSTIIRAFNPEQFLERLNVLEQATKQLKDGTKTPVVVPEASKYFQPGMGPKLNFFKEKEHRLLIEAGLQELRDFGELGRSLRDTNEKLCVDIHIFIPGPEYDNDPEIMNYRKEKAQKDPERDSELKKRRKR